MQERTKIPPFFPDTLRRLDYLIEQLGLTRYLEIGLGNGGTYDNVKAASRVGVDPHPWNPAASKLEGVHTLTSDQYFTRFWDSGQKFDLILLDGLHTAEQTYRDFVNSLHFAHDTTVWLIDDVMPNDAFSAIPEQDLAVKLRKMQTGVEGGAWHGDVYKVVWMIKTFHNNMRIRSFTGSQPQSLVYYAPNKNAPSAHTLGEIGNLNFIDTLVRRGDYNVGEENDILTECVAALKKRSAELRKNAS